MRIALTGAGGQLGSDLRALLPGEVIPLGRPAFDLTNPSGMVAALEAARPDVVVNAAAYTAVDQAESEPELAHAVNAAGPREIARWCRRAGVPFVHFSTDYVFSGATGACTSGDPETRPGYVEDDPTDPQGVYARSKRVGEEFIQAECPQHIILRTCGLYGAHPSATKGNFVRTMLRLGRERMRTGEPLSVVDDHFCTPTFTRDLAEATARMIASQAWGLYHATNAGRTTWCRFAREIFRLAGLAVVVNPTTSAARPAVARRPSFSVLDCSKLVAVLGSGLPPWQDALSRHLTLP